MARAKSVNADIDAIFQQDDLLWEDLKDDDLYISTGSLQFDIFLGGGFKSGVARFCGEPSHGKTMQALNWANQWMSYWGEKGVVIYYDVEGRLSRTKLLQSPIGGKLADPEWSQRIRVRRNNVYELVGNDIIQMVGNNPEGYKFFIVFDSLDMMKSIHDTGKGLQDNNKIASSATVSNGLMKDLGPKLNAEGHHFHILSQVRANLNMANPNSPKTQMSGGWVVKHAADVIGTITKQWSNLYIYENPNAIKVADKGKIIGHYFEISFEKTPNDKDGQRIKIPIKRGAGIWREREVADLLIAYGFVVVRKSWVAFEETFFKEISDKVEGIPDKTQGIQKYYELFEENPKLTDVAESKLREIFVNNKATVF